MGRSYLSNIFKSIKTKINKNSSEILIGIGIAGMITTTIMAVKATPKALILIEEEINRQNSKLSDNNKDTDNDKTHDPITKLKPIDVIKTTWNCYIPSVIVGSISVFCLIGASSVNTRRNAALATAYTLSESALKEYQEKAKEIIGEKKEQTIKDAVAKEKINKNPVTAQNVVITKRGDTLCFDAISGRYFKSDIEKIKKSLNELNRQMLDVDYVSLNDFYYEIGLDNISIGDGIGWNIQNGFIDFNFSSQLTNDGTPCLVLDYRVAPYYDFQK